MLLPAAQKVFEMQQCLLPLEGLPEGALETPQADLLPGYEQPP
jgi:hypothetical protein